MLNLRSNVALFVLALTTSSIASPVVTPASTTEVATLTVSSPTTPSASCTTRIFGNGKFGPLSQSTCTFYESYTTMTEYVDCGGCVLERLGLGPGPVVRCGTNVNAPLGTQTVTSCSADNGTTPATPTTY
ncbi:hypothetical protein GTA08_BOTSDO04777 [Botryosphaeria dothidea]|uniref:Uncharacterized protein n=1 Tax=Botryosphaeria dothidea TaxID=55169 RepID=A0A8H4IW00_9PEZI|nr:hypothetical protein GTA08_BOTSDO04777 [Botryosphaeria dothidea]